MSSARQEPSPPRLREQRRERLAVERRHHELPGGVKRAAGIEQLGVELVRTQRPVRARNVEERPRSVAGDERDRRRCRCRSVAHDRAPVDAALVQQLDDEVSEPVGADLPGDARPQPEPHERTRRVECATAALKLDLAGEAERASRRQLVDGAADDVGDEDPEADDVHASILPRAANVVRLQPHGLGGSMTLEGKVALVTGASRGIGAAVAHMLDERGVQLGLASRSGDDLGLDAVAQPCDVRELEQLESIVAATVERFGRLDILVANAGVGAYGPFLDLSLEHLDEMIDVNLKGTLYAVRAALPHLVESGQADIVTVASEAGRRGLPFEATYCASKFGQVGFTRALDHELREHGVRCTNVCPGGVATDFALDDGRGRSPDALPG